MQAATRARADPCSPQSRVTARYPGFDVQPENNIGDPVPVASADDCLRQCLDLVPGCGSAVWVSNSKLCYFKAGDLELRQSGFPQRFVAIGCEGELPDAPPAALPAAPPVRNNALLTVSVTL